MTYYYHSVAVEYYIVMVVMVVVVVGGASGTARAMGLSAECNLSHTRNKKGEFKKKRKIGGRGNETEPCRKLFHLCITVAAVC